MNISKTVIKTMLLFSLLLLFGCTSHETKLSSSDVLDGDIYGEKVETYVYRIDTLGLIILYPHYKNIDLVCGELPDKSDNNVILFAEAAFTGKLLQEFNHSNVAGNHVSSGILYNGYSCKRNTGAFVYYNGNWDFCYKTYSQNMNNAAKNGGCAFGQELIIHRDTLVETVRDSANVNQFRALCSHNGNLCIIESSGDVRFGEFKKKLQTYGVSDAIYLDMGEGWNHAWYRSGGNIIELHPKKHDYCTNWIVFYK